MRDPLVSFSRMSESSFEKRKPFEEPAERHGLVEGDRGAQGVPTAGHGRGTGGLVVAGCGCRWGTLSPHSPASHLCPAVGGPAPSSLCPEVRRGRGFPRCFQAGSPRRKDGEPLLLMSSLRQTRSSAGSWSPGLTE